LNSIELGVGAVVRVFQGEDKMTRTVLLAILLSCVLVGLCGCFLRRSTEPAAQPDHPVQPANVEPATPGQGDMTVEQLMEMEELRRRIDDLNARQGNPTGGEVPAVASRRELSQLEREQLEYDLKRIDTELARRRMEHEELVRTDDQVVSRILRLEQDRMGIAVSLGLPVTPPAGLAPRNAVDSRTVESEEERLERLRQELKKYRK
jgi:hypothetical protein